VPRHRASGEILSDEEELNATGLVGQGKGRSFLLNPTAPSGLHLAALGGLEWLRGTSLLSRRTGRCRGREEADGARRHLFTGTRRTDGRGIAAGDVLWRPRVGTSGVSLVCSPPAGQPCPCADPPSPGTCPAWRREAALMAKSRSPGAGRAMRRRLWPGHGPAGARCHGRAQGKSHAILACYSRRRIGCLDTPERSP
jgi:hypothetical protein